MSNHNHDDHAHGHDHDHDDHDDHGHDHDDHDHDHHGHGHGHDHGHGHHHHELPDKITRAFAIGIVLNAAFVVIEFGYGVHADSLALIADAGHNLSDVLSLILAWGAARLGQKAATARRTYGFQRATILASLVNAVTLLIALGAIVWEAIARLTSEQPQVAGMTVIVVAGIGVVINTVTALLFMTGHKEDLNVQGAFMHMVADAAISVGVVLAGVAILFTQWHWLDPVLSIAIALIILWGTWGLLKESLNLTLDAVPRHVDPEAIAAHLSGVEGVQKVDDFHVWSLSTSDVALTTHLVVDKLPTQDTFLDELSADLRDTFSLAHVTIQLREDPDRKQGGCADD